MMQMLMMMVRNDDDDDDDDDDGEEARSKAMHESAFRSDAGRRVPKRGPYRIETVGGSLWSLAIQHVNNPT